MKKKLKKLLNPKVIIPTFLSVAFLAFVVAFANSGHVFGEILQDLPKSVLPVLGLALLYLVAKGAQWHIYLLRLDIRPRWQEMLAPYVGGEIGNSLPMGVYLENYLLKGALGEAFGKSAAATTWMLITEILTCLAVLVAIPVPNWFWLRPLAAAVLVGMIIFGAVFLKTRYAGERLERWQPRRKILQSVKGGLQEFLEGSGQLLSWHTFVYGIPLTAIYLGAHATALFVISRVLIPGFGWTEAAAAFAFSLLLVLLVPLLPHLGSVEASGLGVMLQFGIMKNDAVASFLTLRLLMTGGIIAICCVVLLLLHREVGQIIRRLARKRGRGQKDKGDQGEQEERAEQPRQGAEV